MTASDLGSGPAITNGAKSVKPVLAREKGKVAGKPAPRVTKFLDGGGNTWGGMGKQPQWFNAALAAGKRPEDLLTKRTA